MFKDGTVKGRNTFITFNYDNILEDALVALNLPLSYGFKARPAHMEPSAKASSNPGALQVLKLHGSINWARRPEKSERAFSVFGNYRDVLQEQLVPELVPPTWRKIFQGQLDEVWERAVGSLQTATRVIIIGFSIPPTDTHFKYLIAAGLQQHVSLR